MNVISMFQTFLEEGLSLIDVCEIKQEPHESEQSRTSKLNNRNYRWKDHKYFQNFIVQ